MKKIYLSLFTFFLLSILSLTTNASDINKQSNNTICLNEFLKPCSNQVILNDKQNKLTKIKTENLKNAKNKKFLKKVVKKKISKNKKKIKKKLVKKKKRNDINIETASNKSNMNLGFDANSLFNEYKKKVVEYGKKNKFPNINE